MLYKKIANVLEIIATSRLVTFAVDTTCVDSREVTIVYALI